MQGERDNKKQKRGKEEENDKVRKRRGMKRRKETIAAGRKE